MKSINNLLGLVALSRYAAALPAGHGNILEQRWTTNVDIDSGTIVGKSFLGVESYKGIPYANPPVGDLRLRPPQKFSGPLGTFDATETPASCPQMFASTGSDEFLSKILGYVTNTPLFMEASGQSEDCLTINVQRPAGTKAGDKLPVLFWIFGGGFELGSTSMYDGSGLVLNGIVRNQPFIFVAVNYRTGGFGFMPGKEILEDGSANLGLLDQRLGLEWTADNIEAFGGDPSKVTIWGESAGAISVTDQMLLYDGDNTYKGKPLFRGGIMNSGSVAPADKVDGDRAQAVYNAVVDEAGCSSADDTLACLRSLDYDTFKNAADSVPGILSYHSVALSYLPRPDGTVITDSPDKLIASGKYAAVPMIIGDQEDEGTLFSLFQSNVTTEAELVDYLNTIFFPDASREQMQSLVDTYSADAAAGSPFRTGRANQLYPEFKRLSAILGDLVFTLTRRLFLETTAKVNPDVPSWSYLASYDYGTPILGTFHGSDILQVFYGLLPNHASDSIQTYYLNFLYNQDPNVGNGSGRFRNWPRWSDSKKLVQFFSHDNGLLDDDFRTDSYEWIASHVDILHI